ncbi:MAG: M43 family zinc metalloprotease [Bacteroidota bacterium]|nr:M43 family zinc metalloprotease [Bacteroidota bacterium]
MRKFLFIYFIFSVLFFDAQIKNGGIGGGGNVQNMVTTLKHDTCLNKKFSIVFYVVLDSNYSPGVATQPTLNLVVANLNAAFKRICVEFLNCSTVYIPHYPYNNWTKNIVDPIVTSNWYTDKTINFYIPTQVTGAINDPNGYAYPPPATASSTPKDVIVCDKAALLSTNNANFQSSTPIHEMGHFFGLPHTFDEIGLPIIPAPPAGAISYEFFNRTNCYSQGDGFCDTEADPYPLGYSPNTNPVPVCHYLTGVQDGNVEYYVPPVDNLMSLYPCRCHFSQEQYNYMARIILTKRLYLH